jgi:hypothetical protein
MLDPFGSIFCQGQIRIPGLLKAKVNKLKFTNSTGFTQLRISNKDAVNVGVDSGQCLID